MQLNAQETHDRLRRENQILRERLNRWKSVIGEVMPPDFKDWHDNHDDDLPLVVKSVIESLKTREQIAWEMLEKHVPTSFKINADVA